MNAAQPALSRSPWNVGAALVVAAAALLMLSLCVGSDGLDAGLLIGLWSDLSANYSDGVWQVVVSIRLPRGIGAWLVGALLGLAGAIAQGLFRNPLADPFLLGSASGASLGVALLLVMMGSAPVALPLVQMLGLTGAAFVGALIAVVLAVMLSGGVGQVMRLLLSGVIVGVVMGALAQLVLTLSPQVLLAMQGFMLGSTAFLGWPAVWVLCATLLLCGVMAVFTARALDALSLGEATAQTLGLPMAQLRWWLVGTMALASGAAVAQAGLIAFVGLAAPHVVRRLCAAQHRAFVLLSALCGGGLLLASDVLARGLLAPLELPVGVLTAILGGAYLLWLMHSSARAGQGHSRASSGSLL